MASQNALDAIEKNAQAAPDILPDNPEIDIAELRDRLTELEQKIHDAFLLPIGPVGISYVFYQEPDNATITSESNPPT